MTAWTLPQTLAGLALVGWHRARGIRSRLVRFGPFLVVFVPAKAPASSGLSLGLVIVADPEWLLHHECCHVVTAVWLGWLYLPVYGLEYAVLGHDRSPHERLTCWLEGRVPWRPERWATTPGAPHGRP